MGRKIKPGQGIPETVSQATQVTYDSNKEFSIDDLLQAMTDADNHERERRIRWNEDNKEPPPLTEAEIFIHKKSDVLLGNYPMSMNRLTELIELIPNALMEIDYYGMMFPVKSSVKMWLSYIGDDLNQEQLYMNYLKSVKPHISMKNYGKEK